MQETLVPSLGQEDPLKKEMATHSSVLPWRIPWTKKKKKKQSPVGYSPWVPKSQTRLSMHTQVRGLKALPCRWRMRGFRAQRRPVWLTLLLGAQCQPPPLFLFSLGSLGRCQPSATTPGHTAAPSSFSLFFKLIFTGV